MSKTLSYVNVNDKLILDEKESNVFDIDIHIHVEQKNCDIFTIFFQLNGIWKF